MRKDLIFNKITLKNNLNSKDKYIKKILERFLKISGDICN